MAHSPFHGAFQDRGLEADAVGAAVFEDFEGVGVVVVDDDSGPLLDIVRMRVREGGGPGVDGAFLVEDTVVQLPDRVGFIEGFQGQKSAVEEHES